MTTFPHSFQRRSFIRGVILAIAALPLLSPSILNAENKHEALNEALQARYTLTKVGVPFSKSDSHRRIIEPGTLLVVRIPGIYADMANAKHAVVNTIFGNGEVSQQLGQGDLTSPIETSTGRQLNVNEQVYVTKLHVKSDSIHFALMTHDVTTLAGGNTTRYRSKLVFRFPKKVLDTMSVDDVMKIIDSVIANAETATAVHSRTVKVGMSDEEVEDAFGTPETIADLGATKIYFYKDMKVLFNDHKVAGLQ